MSTTPPEVAALLAIGRPPVAITATVSASRIDRDYELLRNAILTRYVISRSRYLERGEPSVGLLVRLDEALLTAHDPFARRLATTSPGRRYARCVGGVGGSVTRGCRAVLAACGNGCGQLGGGGGLLGRKERRRAALGDGGIESIDAPVESCVRRRERLVLLGELGDPLVERPDHLDKSPDHSDESAQELPSYFSSKVNETAES